MARPRFLFTTRVLPSTDGRPSGVAWRLVGGNNHELGRSHAAFGDYATCVDAVHQLRVAVDALELDIEIVGADGSAEWAWQLVVDGMPVAVACRWYRRPREADYNLAQFLAAVPDAGIADVVGGQPPRRELLRPEFVLPHLEPAPPFPVDESLPVDGSLPDDEPLSVREPLSVHEPEAAVTQDLPTDRVDELTEAS